MMIRRRRKNLSDRVDVEIEELPTNEKVDSLADPQGYLVPVPSIRNSDEEVNINYEAVDPEIPIPESNSGYQRASLFITDTTYEMANENPMENKNVVYDTSTSFEDAYYEIEGDQPSEILYDEASYVGFEDGSETSTLYTLAKPSPEYDIASNN